MSDTNAEREPWMTKDRTPFLRLLPGGPFDPVVELLITDDSDLVVTAAWTNRGERRATRETIDDYDAARDRAHQLADQLATGVEPRS